MPASSDFNAQAYLQRYPDLNNGYVYKSADGTWKYGQPTNRELKKLSDNLFWHWQNFGIKEGRVPGADLPGTVYDTTFDAGAYLARYPDVRGIDELSGKVSAYAANPLQHYQTFGMSQGRKPGFELLYQDTPTGMSSPGTTKNVVGTLKTVNTGDLNSLAVLNPVDLTTTPAIATDNTGDITVWIGQNPWLFLGLAVGAGYLLIHKSKGGRKSKLKMAI